MCQVLSLISDLTGNNLRRLNVGSVPRVVLSDLKPKKVMDSPAALAIPQTEEPWKNGANSVRQLFIE
jgi:hypothetical protein